MKLSANKRTYGYECEDVSTGALEDTHYKTFGLHGGEGSSTTLSAGALATYQSESRQTNGIVSIREPRGKYSADAEIYSSSKSTSTATSPIADREETPPAKRRLKCRPPEG